MTLDFDITVWAIGILSLMLILIFLLYKKQSVSYLFCFSIFWIYLLFVMRETLFPISLSTYNANIFGGEAYFWASVNLIPFYFGPLAALQAAWYGFILNIVLTMPFGFGINFLARLKVLCIFLIALVVGLTIEGIQFVISTMIGYLYRVIDVNDLIANAIGVLIGYILFRIFAYFYTKIINYIPICQIGIFSYVYNVCIDYRDL